MCVDRLTRLDYTSAGDGVFATEKNGHLSLVDLKSNTTRSLVAFSDVQDVRLCTRFTAFP